MQPSLVIALISIAWSGGVFVGMFASRFVAKKQCDLHRADLWHRLDSIQHCLTGGHIQFELRMITPSQGTPNAK